MKKVDPASRDEILFFDSTQIPDKPALFICAMSLGIEVSEGRYIAPIRPFRFIEYWKDGDQLSDEIGEEMVAEIMRRGVPEEYQLPRIVKA